MITLPAKDLSPNMLELIAQPQLLELLWGAGISISAGELSNLLTKGHDDFHAEKDELLATGIRCSHYLQTGNTRARNQGQNGFFTVIVNELFTWFGTNAGCCVVNVGVFENLP